MRNAFLVLFLLIPFTTVLEGCGSDEPKGQDWVGKTLSERPAILVTLHYCGGSGPGFYTETEFARLGGHANRGKKVVSS
jgi:hypothetical protein